MHPDIYIQENLSSANAKLAQKLADQLSLSKTDVWKGGSRPLSINGHRLTGIIPHFDYDDVNLSNEICKIFPCRTKRDASKMAAAVRAASKSDYPWGDVAGFLEDYADGKTDRQIVAASLSGSPKPIGFIRYLRWVDVDETHDQTMPEVNYVIEPEIVYVVPEQRSKLIGAAMWTAVQFQAWEDLTCLAEGLSTSGIEVSFNPVLEGEAHSSGGQRLMEALEATMDDWLISWNQDHENPLIHASEDVHLNFCPY